MGVLSWLLGKKQEEQRYPREFGLIVLNGIARSKGISDDHNKIIIHYKDGVEFKRYPYSPAFKKALETTYQMPVMEEEINGDEEQFEFDTVAEFGTTKLVKKN